MLYVCAACAYALGLSLIVSGGVDAGNVICALTTLGCCGLLLTVKNKRWVYIICALIFAASFIYPRLGTALLPAAYFAGEKDAGLSMIIIAAGLAAALERAYAGLLWNGLCGAAVLFLTGLILRRSRETKRAAFAAADSEHEKKLELIGEYKALEESVAFELERASAKERERIAAEMHDNAGHMLSRAILMTGALKTSARDAETARGLNELEDTLLNTMSSLRAAVHKLRDEAINLEHSVKECALGFPRFKCGINYSLSREAPAAVKYIFISAVREGFSNAARHSDADEILIDIEEHPAFYKLKLKDNGAPCGNAAPGMGLLNIKRRAESLGGRADFGFDAGFTVHIIIPKEKV